MGYRKTGSTVIMVENTELTEKVNNIEGELDKSNKQSVTLTHGLQVVNAEQNSPLDVSIEGRTLVNLLGIQRENTVFTNYASGANMFISTSGGLGTSVDGKFIELNSSKYYLLIVEWNNGSDNNINLLRAYAGGVLADGTQLGSSFTIFGNKAYIKFQPPSTDTVKLALRNNVANSNYDFKNASLFEISNTEYNNIGSTWDDAEVARRYPYVDSVQHVQNPYVIAEGENLLPPFTEWNLHANAKVKSPYELELNATGNLQRSYVIPSLVKGQTYTLSGGDYTVEEYSGGTWVKVVTEVRGTGTFNYNPNGTNIYRISTYNVSSGTFTFTNPMLTLGNQSKPFVPRNPSALYAEMKLGALSDKKDILYRSNGEWYLRKNVEKDVKLDGSLGWVFGSNETGFKVVNVLNFFYGLSSYDQSLRVVKYNGKIILPLLPSGVWTNGDEAHNSLSSNQLKVSISDTDSGWGETYAPTANEIKAYFWGWRMCDGTFGVPYDGTGTKTWYPIGDTDLNRAVTTVPTSEAPTITDGKVDYYKLSYALATPQTINVTEQVEGDLVANGDTQVEVGSGVIVREKANPYTYNNGYTYINDSNLNGGSSSLKNKTLKILNVHKNGVLDLFWKHDSIQPFGKQRTYISTTNYDPTAEYTVTYLVLDRHQFTNNLLSAPSTYNNSLKSVVDDVVAKQADISSTVSVHVRAIAELYKRVKALGG